MMHTSDPLERLRAANPVPPEAMEALRPDPVLFRAVTSGAPASRRARRRSRILVAVLATTSVLGGAVAYGLLRDGVPKPQNVACYEQADLEARTDVVSVGDDGPIAACAELWQRGTLGPGGQVPPLVECVLETGVVGVFPASAGDDVCRRLVAPGATTTSPPPTLADVNDRFLAFRDAVLPTFRESPCVERAAATRLVRTELDRAGLSDWQIRAGEFSAERPCATLSFRPENREIVLTPAPPR